MPRGGDHGGHRPRVLTAIVKKSFILEPSQAAKLRELARAWQCSESEVVRRIIGRAPDSKEE